MASNELIPSPNEEPPHLGAHRILTCLWPHLSAGDFSEKASKRFIGYLESELSILETQSGQFVITDKIDALKVVELLRTQKSDSLAILVEGLACPRTARIESAQSSANPQDELSLPATQTLAYRKSIELAVRLWLTINIDSFEVAKASNSFPPVETSPWTDQSSSLQSLVHSKFRFSPTFHERTKDVTIPSHMTLPEICMRQKYRVCWSNSLLDHLDIREDGDEKEIVFYEHLFALKYHLEYSDQGVIPTRILEEAVDTFNLLFPMTASLSKSTRRFLMKEGRTFHMLSPCGRAKRNLELQNYQFWGPKIQQLIHIMASPPPGWRQVRLDRDARNFEKVMTIWIGIVATVLAVITLVFGIISLWLAFTANDLAREAFELAKVANYLASRSFELDRKQACMAEDAGSLLSEFCS